MLNNIKTILVTGGNGQLGRSLQTISTDYSNYQFIFTTRDELDLSNSSSITQYFQQHQFDLIINCAAYTAVDKAEEEQALADAINHLAVKQLAEISQQQQSLFIHISTDYVYDGRHYQPYLETHPTDPQNIYGSSKLKGEQAIQAIASNAIIIRTSWVYSEFGNNFVKTMLRLGQEREQLNVIFDQIGSPTYARDLARGILKTIPLIHDNKGVSVYHFSNEGVCSWYDFAQTIFELSHINCVLTPIETKAYPTPAKRPHFSVLNKAKIRKKFNLTIPYWKDSLRTCLQILQEHKNT